MSARNDEAIVTSKDAAHPFAASPQRSIGDAATVMDQVRRSSGDLFGRGVREPCGHSEVVLEDVYGILGVARQLEERTEAAPVCRSVIDVRDERPVDEPPELDPPF
ncbi:MAG: hypothetical protein HC923_07290, partial [Myxococcales bacterium]|nr:hypothetical protein [Myxococcales bacterium]